LENECSDDGSPFLLRTTTAARLLDRSPCRLHVRWPCQAIWWEAICRSAGRLPPITRN